MNPLLKKFIEKILIFSLVLGIITWAIFNFGFPAHYFSVLPILFLIFISISILVHAILLKAGKKRPTRFSTDFMLSIIIKLFVYSTSVGVLMFFNKAAIVPIVITFLSLYFLYTFFEIRLILSDLNQEDLQKKQDSPLK